MVTVIVGLLAFFCASSLFAAVMSLLMGSTTATVAVSAIGVGALAARSALRVFAPRDSEFDSELASELASELSWRGRSIGADVWLEGLGGAFVLLIAYRQFGWLLYQDGVEIRTLSPNNFGDLPLHLNLIRFIAQGASWPLKNPIFASEALRYPLGADLHSALWEVIGVSTQSHLFWVGMTLTLATLILVRSWAGWWGIAALFFSGGWLGWKAPVGADWQAQVAWKNLFLSVLLTQRGLLFGLPIGLFLLLRFRRVFLEARMPARGEAAWLGFFWGSLAFFHVHSFVAVSLLLVGFACAGAALEGNGARAFVRRLTPAALRCLLIAVPLGGFFFLHASDWLGKAQVARWAPGWTMVDGESPLLYLGNNFGPWLVIGPLALAAWAYGPLGRDRRTLYEATIYVLAFSLFFNWMLAPWPWDNVKVLIWPALGLARVARDAVTPAVRAWTGGGGRAAQGFAFSVLAILAGGAGFRALTEASARNSVSVRIASRVELADTKGAIALVPIDSVFLASPTHDHALSVLGRARVLGYAGHLWSHAIDSAQTAFSAERIFRGEPDWERLVRELKITHIFWGPQELAAYGNGPRPWQIRFPNISGVPGHAVYRVQFDP